MSLPTDRRTLVPSFTGNHDPGLADLVERCRDTIFDVRLDVTALPIESLSFVARPDGIGLVVDMVVPDRDRRAVEWIHIWRSLLCPWEVLHANGPEYLVRWMRETIANTLAHEVDESITLRGERVFDPHRPLTRDPR